MLPETRTQKAFCAVFQTIELFRLHDKLAKESIIHTRKPGLARFFLGANLNKIAESHKLWLEG